MRFLIVPGINDSGPDHWQSVWEQGWGHRATRIAPASWDDPELDDWVEQVDRLADEDTVIVAHSLGCLAAAAWLRTGRAAGAFLVAPPEPTGPEFPTTAPSFQDPGERLTGPTLVVGSSDDPYSSLAVSQQRAEAWGATYLLLGAHGHINAAAVGAWSEGQRLLTAFVAGLDRT